MTSHREAPGTSRDPVADNTDLYAFVSPDATDTVTIISNFIPLEEPAGGPNFANFGDDVLYEILVDNDGDAEEDITYQFRFKTTFHIPGVFLYNTAPISSLTDPHWNIRQTYSVTKVLGDRREDEGTSLGKDLPSPPVNIGPRSTPLSTYTTLVDAAINTLSDGSKVFAGQRGEGFYVDLGSIFDLGTLRPFEGAHLIPTPAGDPSVNTLKGYNVHSIALQVPKKSLTADGKAPTDPTEANSTIGIWTSASRRKAHVHRDSETDDDVEAGPWTQVSRLGMPLINEVIIPVGKKDFWNASEPKDDSQFLPFYQDPTLQNLLPVLYPGTVFSNLKTLLLSPPASRPRIDLVAILLTGIPAGIITGFQNVTTSVVADLLRLNMAFAPSDIDTNPIASDPDRFGLLGGDFDGFPNGRRVFDNTVAVELRAIAGATYPLVVPSFTPDGAALALTDGTNNDLSFLPHFPYLATPYDGFTRKHD